jgi:flagellar basal body rod protein FlgG
MRNIRENLIAIVLVVALIQLGYNQYLLTKAMNALQPQVTQNVTEPGAAPAQAAQFQTTGRALDMAIDGIGFFEVTLPDGRSAYTRDGRFGLDANGNIVSRQGFPLSEGITIPSDYTDIAVDAFGVVNVRQSGIGSQQTIGTIELTRFVNPEGLKWLPSLNVFLETESSGSPSQFTPGQEDYGYLMPGKLERAFSRDSSATAMLIMNREGSNTKIADAIDR